MGLDYDIVVIGGGPAGENVAWYAREHGFEVALVERELLGGECSFWACMPSKALLRPGEVLAAARRVPGAAVTGAVDLDATMLTRNAFAANWDDGSQASWLESTGTALYRGAGRIVGERTVAVDTTDGAEETLAARRAVVVATGTSALVPPIPGIEDVETWDNRDITSTDEVPERLLVLGGGVVGVEMAQAFARLGTEHVTVIEMLDRLLPAEEPFVGEELALAFKEEGIDVRVNARAVEVGRSVNGVVSVKLADESRIVGDRLLVATGRRPNTRDLGLDTIGLEPGRFVDTDDHLRAVGVEGGWLYAVGDVNGRALLTHHGKYQARVVADHLAGRDAVALADHEALVRVVFTDPQVAAVGLTEQQARDADIDVDVLTVSLGSVAGTSIVGIGSGGTAQLVLDRDSHRIVGATFTGPGVGEMIHAATIAIIGGIPIDQLWHAVPAFPTISEIWLRLLEADRFG